MKDAYSFDRDVAAALKSYDTMFDAYQRIFARMGLVFRAVAADTGSIGGSCSHEFHVIADTGEDAIAYCPTSDYAANVELAEAVQTGSRPAPAQAMEEIATPAMPRCEDVAALLGLPLSATVKSVVFAVDAEAEEGKPKPPAQVVLVLVRGDHEANEIKVGKLPGMNGARMATEEEILGAFNCKPGYLGPVGLKADVRVIADRAVAVMSDFTTGANRVDAHFKGVNFGRDLPEPEVADVRNVVAGDPSPDGKGALEICRGIEVGHVFYLGTKYSSALNATFLAENGKPAVMEMGCYGIGVTRILGAAIEQNHDARGMIWPISLAPFELVICPVGYHRFEQVRKAADELYAQLQAAGVDVMLDDRDERPGAMFADWELIGVPYRMTVGDRGLKEGKVEWQVRRPGADGQMPAAEGWTLEGSADRALAEIQQARAKLSV